MIRKIFAFVVVVLALCACKQTPVDNYIPLTSVSLNQTEEEMLVGETLQLKVLLTPSNATEQDVMWGTNKRMVATVSETGLVTAVGEGTAIITVTASGDKKATCTITVLKPRVEVQSITLDNDNITIAKGQTAVLKATVNPANATDATVAWSTSDEAVAKVDQTGKVTAVGGGSAVITASAGCKSADCSVTVTVPVEGVSLDRNEIALVEGETATLTATVLPDDASDKSVEWTSSNGEVATVDSEGTITAIKEGTATITAKAGDKTATCGIIVEKKIIHVESITISRPELNLIVGTTETLTVTILPEDATYQSCTWASTNSEIAEVDQTGKVTAKTVGTVTVTATTTDGGHIAACEVTVYVPYIPVENITLSTTTLNLNKGQTATLTAIISPTNATVQTVSWSSTNMDVAQIDRYGKVTAAGGGQATILAEAGNITAECVVTVTVPVESIELDSTELSLEEGEIATLQALVSPDDATDKTITWTSTNTSVATVDAEGKVTAIGEGMATISAKSGSVTAVCTVSVSKKVIHVTSIEISESSLNIFVGETATLYATVLPVDATDRSYNWSSSNSDIADIDQTGKVTAISAGTAIITATTTDGNLEATCRVTVIGNQIIIKEVYTTGCQNSAITYINDAYVILYNNTGIEADASDIVFGAIAPATASSNNRFYGDGDILAYENQDWIPAYSALWWFTSEVKIPAYSQIVVVLFGAIDHTIYVWESVDLSNAEYYWMSNTGIPNFTHSKYATSENIPTSHYLNGAQINLGSAWVVSNKSPGLYIGKMHYGEAHYLCYNTDAYDTTQGTTAALAVAKFPKANVVDAVDAWPSARISDCRPRFSADINTGYVAITNNLGHSIYRNVDKEATEALEENAGKLVYNYAGGTEAEGGSTDPSGIDAEASFARGAHIIYLDTNNSSTDFHERKVASLKR